MKTDPVSEQIDIPPPRQMMAVDRAAWTRLKRLVSRLSGPKGRWQNAAWFASAASISFFVAATTTTNGLSLNPPSLFLALTAVFIVAAGILFIADISIGDRVITTRQDIVEEMQEIEVESTASSTATQLNASGEEVAPS